MIWGAQEQKKYGWCRSGLRERYRPKTAICRGLINAAPWVDVVLVIVFFLLLDSRVVLCPTVELKLPETNLAAEQIRRGVTAVVLSHEGMKKGERTEMVFFRDKMFVVKDDGMTRLLEQFSAVATNHANAHLIVEADVDVRWGTIALLCDIAKRAGFKEVDFAMRPSEEESDDRD